MEKKIPIIIDCDTGTDDAIALIMACAAKKLSLKAVTTVAGNQTVDKTTLNTLKVLSFLGAHKVPVARGADRPLIKPLYTAAQVHGTTGLGGVILPDPKMHEEELSAVQLLYSVLTKSSEPITIVCTAPLTNIALLLRTYPEVKKHIEKLVVMGGGFDHGNETVAAEFNIYVDPHAADIVFKSGVPIVLCPLDMTETAMITFDEIDAFAQQKGKVCRLAADIFQFNAKYYTSIGARGIAMHDPTTIAYLIKPEMFTTEQAYVQIETSGSITEGMTIADHRLAVDKEQPNTTICTGIDRNAFVRLVAECCSSFD
nr:nucleoside hydrolase [Treponema sp.]